MNTKTKKFTIIIICILAVIAIALVVLGLRTDDNQSNTAGNAQIDADKVATVASNLNTPWSVVFYKGIPLVSFRDTGEVLELDKNGKARTVGVVAGATHRGEGGLLGLAIDDNNRLYAYYTTATDNRISRFTISGEAGSLRLSNANTIIDGLPSSAVHNGGRIAFGPDKQLYATVGDAANPDSAQELSKLQGKILRMTPDGGVPTDNPFPNSLVYSYGHRNPQGIAWSDDGTMYATEFGQSTWDELNVIQAGGNYGWPLIEGMEERDGYISPVQQWPTSEASPSGMAYSDGVLYMANLRGEVLRTVATNNLSASQQHFAGEYGRIRDVAKAPDGTIWFVTNNTDGRGNPGTDDDRILSITPKK